ncbi:thiolase family protein [Raineyella fluvialis]|uniref:Probable acetyl-CoA acetyltransferase n=1 Tax=Raineyella fluvialis TaxID=2662261 RepID=A0A5Q2FCN5_9ACTN|nr:thiolase family protein [Raineyella fluvialis]QGF22465.1 acetyl-CoA C-acyltransferase [Raineyella fluvialis]
MKTSNDPIVVLGYARTPVGSFGKSLANVPAHVLGATAATAALERSGLTPADPQEWIIGCVGSTGNDAYISRRVAIAAGAPAESTAMTVNRLCGSAMQAIALGAAELMVGESDIVVAGGVENMSAQPYLDFSARSGATLGDRRLMDGTSSMVTDPFTDQPMGITAENVAARFGVSRQAQDEFAVESQRRAQAALADGAVTAEIAAVTIPSRKGDIVVDTDEHPRAGITVEKLAAMRPVFAKDGTVTAGNASGINDGACVLVLTRASVAAERGLTPLAELVDFTKVGIEPEIMGYAPKPAIEKILGRNGMSAGDLGWIELNEAFAAQAVPVIRDTGLDPSVVNPLGGAIAWGHPIGATGAIISARTIENIRRHGHELGMATMCIGGGQAVASIWRAL